MGTAPRLAARPCATLAAVTVTLLMAALACGLAALLTAGPAQAAPPGSVVWKKTPDPTRGPDRLYLSARGPSGSLYAAGMAGSNKGDIWITRYKASGAVQWSVRWDDAKHKMDVARAMAVDAAGNVYVCGQVDGTATVTDSVVVKYSATGKKKWASVKRFGGYEEASAIGLDSSGNAYVTGHEQPVDGRSLLYVAKFTAAKGAVDWTWLQDTPDTDSSGLAIAVTRTGTCYAAGTIADISAGFDSSGYLVKVTGGARDWEKTYAGPAGKSDWWLAAELAPAGGVVVAGSTGMGGPADFVAARYTEAGDRPWLGTYDVPGTYTTELLEDLAVARDGSIWVCGSSDDYVDPDTIRRGAVVRWSPAGDAMGATIGSASAPAMLEAVTVDSAGNAYVAGGMQRGAGADGVAAKFTPAGTRSWLTYVRHTSASDDFLEDIALGPTGSVYSVGTLNDGARNSPAVALRIRR